MLVLIYLYRALFNVLIFKKHDQLVTDRSALYL
jgi:hypothetical protein